MTRVLLAEDNPAHARLIQELLNESAPARFDLSCVHRLSEVLQRISEETFGAILLDLGLPDAQGLEAVEAVANAAPGLAIVVVTGLQDDTVAVEAVQKGAQDYLVKGQASGDLIARTIRYSIERKRMQLDILRLALHDNLTDLANRTLFTDRLEVALARCQREKGLLGVLLLDLDHFKLINDTLGHAAGDRLLQSLAERLRCAMRASDTVARLGGDEFAVILPELTQIEHVEIITEKVRSILESPFLLLGDEQFVTASIGVTLYPQDGADAATLLRNADTALYRAKRQGRNTVQFYTPATDLWARERLSMKNRLRRALERDELVLHYQPLVDLSSGKIGGVEALLRWRHPDLGLVPPTQFIPLAEETGLIIPIGEWVLLRAFQQVRSWHEAGFGDLRLAANLSSRQIHQSSFPEKVRATLDECNVESQYLELELTESDLLRNEERVAAALRSIAAMGIGLSIDDFGTGYSSLNHLRRFPVNTVKIDRSFIRDLETNTDDAAIVGGIIEMARGLRMRVIAEGVETAGQLAFLRHHHCHQIQGYYFSRPLCAEAMTGLLHEGTALDLPSPRTRSAHH